MWWMMTVASAQTPLALPAGSPSPASSQFGAIMAFRDEHLSVREVRRYVPGSTTVFQTGWGFGPGAHWWGWGWNAGSVVTVGTPRIEERWAVFEGAQRLSVPAYLDAIGERELALDLGKRIDRSRRASTGLQAVGWVAVLGGVITTVVGANADTFEDSRQLTAIGLGVSGAGLVSLLVGNGQRNRARRLTFDYDQTQSFDDVRGQVRDYNTDLMQRLGLTPEQALRELDRRRRDD